MWSPLERLPLFTMPGWKVLELLDEAVRPGIVFKRKRTTAYAPWCGTRRGVVGSLERGSSEVFYWEFVCFSRRPFIFSHKRLRMPLLWFVKIRSGNIVIG